MESKINRLKCLLNNISDEDAEILLKYINEYFEKVKTDYDNEVG